MERNSLGSLAGTETFWVQSQDRLRVKTFNSVTSLQCKLVIKFIRAAEAATGTVRTVTKILYPNNARGTGTPPVSGCGSFPFGSLAGVTRSVSDAGITNGATTLTSATAAFVAGDVGKQITIAGAGSAGSAGPNTPTALYQGQIASVTNGTTAEVNPTAQATVSNAQLVIEPILLADDDGLELGSGWIVGVDINFWQGVPKRGQTYCEVEINRGAFNMHEGIPLIKGYLGASEHLGWPYGPREPKVSGKGGIVVYTVSAPARGSEFTYTCPANARQKLISLRFSLTTSGTAGNRQPIILFDDGTSVFYSSIAPAVQAASLTHAYILSTGPRLDSVTPPAGAIQQSISCSPHIELSETFRIRTSTPNLDTNASTGDAFTSGILCVEEWIEE